MRMMYKRDKLKLYQKRVQSGKELAKRAELVGDKRRQTGKTLKVVSFPQGGEHVPSVRVAGQWLERFGFKLGDEVILTATQGQIIITRKESQGHGSSLV
jgi:hypothetical protein